MAITNNTKHCSKCNQYKTLIEFDQHRRANDGLQYWCRPCLRAASAEWSRKNRERHKSLQKSWVAEHKAHLSVYNAERRAKNPEMTLAQYRRSEVSRDPIKRCVSQALWYAKHGQARAKKYRDRHPGRLRDAEACKRATKRKALPIWADKAAIRAHYLQAQKWHMHVDHIVPLSHPLVCGLHTPANLQLLNWRDNIVKGNRHWPDMPSDPA